MILRRLTIDRFAGLRNREFAFAPGLNVLCGPNEAGKSTVLLAVGTLLDTRSLRKKERELFEGRAFPVSGGDSIRAVLAFDVAGNEYTLSRSWIRGSGPGLMELQGPDGLWTDPDTGLEKLASLLPARPGTVRQVLLTGQAALARTLEALAEDDTRQTLLDLQRGGAAPDMGAKDFLARLASAIGEWFGHWDQEAGFPEGRRGIENPWRKEVGRICAAFYRQEAVRQSLSQAMELEQRRDEASSRLSASSARGGELEVWLETHRQAFADAAERARLEQQAQACELRFARAREANILWPTALADRKRFFEELEAAKAAHTELLAQAERAAVWEHAALERQALAEAQQRETDRLAAAAALSAVPEVDPAALEELEGILQRLPVVESGLAGARLEAEFKAETALEFSLDAPAGRERVALAAGEIRRTRANGAISFEHAGLAIRIVSGTGQIVALLEEQQGLRTRRSDLETVLGTGDTAALRLRLEHRREAERQLELATAEALRALGPRPDLATFTAALAGRDTATPPDRGSPELFKEAGQLQGKIGLLEADLAQTEKKLAELDREYGEHDNLLLMVAECRHQQEETKTALAGLCPLPEGFADPETFRTVFANHEREERTARDAAEEARGEARELNTRLEERFSGRTVEDMARELAAAEADFRKALAEGGVLLRIEAAARSVAEAEPAQDAWLLEATAEWVARLTQGRHQRVEEEDGIPVAVRLTDGNRLPYGLLSAGTQDVFALSLRLALARRLLAGKGGFLVLDDPLVDLDPSRREAACAALADFAADTQILVLTCHPEHAGMLPGNLLVLE